MTFCLIMIFLLLIIGTCIYGKIEHDAWVESLKEVNRKRMNINNEVDRL